MWTWQPIRCAAGSGAFRISDTAFHLCQQGKCRYIGRREDYCRASRAPQPRPTIRLKPRTGLRRATPLPSAPLRWVSAETDNIQTQGSAILLNRRPARHSFLARSLQPGLTGAISSISMCGPKLGQRHFSTILRMLNAFDPRHSGILLSYGSCTSCCHQADRGIHYFPLSCGLCRRGGSDFPLALRI